MSFSWTKIRALGELQVLTKASYLLLIIVPLLAALWPGVKIVINQYNTSLHSSISILENSATHLEFESKRIENNLLNQNIPINFNSIAKNTKTIVEQVEVQIEEIKKNILESSIKRNNLPSTWAFLFFSSLFIFIAHLIYQIFVPELIKEKNIDDYISFKKEEYAKNPSRKDLEYAIEAVYSFQDFEGQIPEKPTTLGKKTGEYQEENKRWELDMINLGSQARYLSAAERNPGAIFTSGFFYSTGVIMILWVIIEQSISVAKATGWLS